MKTIESIIADHLVPGDSGEYYIEREWAIACMKEYAKEAIEEMAQNLDSYVLQIQPHWAQIERLKNKLV